MSTSAPQTPLSQTPSAAPPAPFSQAIGRSRCIVLLAVLAVLLVLISLFLQGTMLAVESVWTSWRDLIAGHAQHFRILEAVVFYLIGVGLYSVFISPMNVTVALGVETLNDLEERAISVIIAILTINFLEHFIQLKSLATLEFGIAAVGGIGRVPGAQLPGDGGPESPQLRDPGPRPARAVY